MNDIFTNGSGGIYLEKSADSIILDNVTIGNISSVDQGSLIHSV